MTPKETAKKLFLEYSIVVTHKTNIDDVGAIICAKKTVNLLISAFENILKYDDSMFLVIDIDFYKNVLKELDEIKIEIHKDIKPKNVNANERLLQELLTLILIVYVANVVVRYSSVKVTYNGSRLYVCCGQEIPKLSF